MPKYPQTPETCLASFLKDKRDELPTVATIRFYKEIIKVITRALISDGRDPLPYHITKEDVLWLFSKKWVSLEVSTKSGYKTALNQYTKFFGNYVMDSVKIRFPKDMRPNVHWLTRRQAGIVVNLDMSPLQKFVIYLFLYCGLRRIEALRLRESSIIGNFLEIMGKGALGGKPRLVPINAMMREALDEYLEWRSEQIRKYRKRRPNAEVTDRLLISVKGGIKPYDEEGDGLDKAVIRKVRVQAGFHFDNHTLRRTFARTMYEKDIPIETIRDILGHETSTETEKYIGKMADRMTSAVDIISYA